MVDESRQNNDRQKWLERVRTEWPGFTVYEKFEYVVSHIVLLILTIVIAIALLRLAQGVYNLLVVNVGTNMDFKIFQTIFGMIMTLLIAMEFRHSILIGIVENRHVLLAKTVVLIAILAIARKFIVIDVKEYDALLLVALGVIVLALGCVYWLIGRTDMVLKKSRH
jgi:uncharacterized membrane protein (DUF373 family)